MTKLALRPRDGEASRQLAFCFDLPPPSPATHRTLAALHLTKRYGIRGDLSEVYADHCLLGGRDR
jgi:hypothetical protein